MLTDLELMEIQVKTLFTHDEHGQLRYVNEPNGARAPRFFWGRTKEGSIWHFRSDLPKELVSRLAALCLAEPVATNLRENPAHLAACTDILRAHAEIVRIWAGPAYRFPDRIGWPTSLTNITEQNADLLRDFFTDWVPGIGSIQPCVAVVDDGRAVSVCCSVRISPQAHEAGVETAERYRGRGYAPVVVAGWATAVRGLGRIPLYSTSWENAPSQRVASKLGLILYGSDLHVT